MVVEQAHENSGEDNFPQHGGGDAGGARACTPRENGCANALRPFSHVVPCLRHGRSASHEPRTGRRERHPPATPPPLRSPRRSLLSAARAHAHALTWSAGASGGACAGGAWSSSSSTSTGTSPETSCTGWTCAPSSTLCGVPTHQPAAPPRLAGWPAGREREKIFVCWNVMLIFSRVED
mgnify:CR=1 FL=1